jgi:hypothetical protein
MIETASTSKRVFQYLHATSSLRVTAHPTAEWIARQLTEACGWELTPSYVIRDRTASTARYSNGGFAPWAFVTGQSRRDLHG